MLNIDKPWSYKLPIIYNSNHNFNFPNSPEFGLEMNIWLMGIIQIQYGGGTDDC